MLINLFIAVFASCCFEFLAASGEAEWRNDDTAHDGTEESWHQVTSLLEPEHRIEEAIPSYFPKDDIWQPWIECSSEPILSMPYRDLEDLTMLSEPLTHYEDDLPQLDLDYDYANDGLHHAPLLSLSSQDSILEAMNGSREQSAPSSSNIEIEKKKEPAKRNTGVRAKGKAAKSSSDGFTITERNPETYSEWARSQPDLVLSGVLKKLFIILGIRGNTAEDTKMKRKWTRRFHLRASEKMKEDIESDDPEKHRGVIEELSVRRKTYFGTFKIGEIREISDRLNRYWRVDEEKAYHRFIKQMRRRPDLVPLSRLDDEAAIRYVAEELTPRRYLVGTYQRHSCRSKDSSDVDTAFPKKDNGRDASTPPPSGENHTLFDMPFIDP